MMPDLTDARGITIEPGDTVIWGYTSDSCVAMAEGVVLMQTNHEDNADAETCTGCVTDTHMKASLTPSGNVRVRVWWRSTGEGGPSVIDVAPNRLIVLGATTPSPRYRRNARREFPDAD